MFRLKVGESLGVWDWTIVSCDACLLDIDDGAEVVKCSNCGAVFHTDCYRNLKNTKSACPKCRVSLDEQ
ncbi:MAG: RING finger domain-containing protein [Nitrososphaerota archaeon]